MKQLNKSSVFLLFLASFGAIIALVVLNSALTKASSENLELDHPVYTLSHGNQLAQQEDIVGPDYTQRACPGQIITYHHTLTNTGTVTDTFSLQVLSTEGWTATLLGGSYLTGTTVLSLQVGPTSPMSFQVSLTVPPGVFGITGTTIITATSQTSPTIRDTAINKTVVVHCAYLPLVQKCWPLTLPYAPTLNPIDNTDGDGDYTVSWSHRSCPSVVSYTLQEATDADFTTNVITYYPGTNTAQVISGKDYGTYYYRVRGHNALGTGEWSNEESVPVTVLTVFCTDTGQGGDKTILTVPKLINRVRISMTERCREEYGFSLWEVEVYGPDTGDTNLSIGATACVSSVERGLIEHYGPHLAIDGKGRGENGTRWSSEFYEPQWFEVILSERKMVNRIVLKWETACAKAYCVSLISEPGKPDSGICRSY